MTRHSYDGDCVGGDARAGGEFSELDLRLVRLVERQSRQYRDQLLCWSCSITKVRADKSGEPDWSYIWLQLSSLVLPIL